MNQRGIGKNSIIQLNFNMETKRHYLVRWIKDCRSNKTSNTPITIEAEFSLNASQIFSLIEKELEKKGYNSEYDDIVTISKL